MRLIVHASVGGRRARIRISNRYGEHPLVIGGAHAARRVSGADVDPASDRALLFGGHSSTTVAPRSIVMSDPVDLEVPALSDLAISLFFPESAAATTTHVLALQTSYLSADPGDATSDVRLRVGRTIATWPFLTGVDVAASPGAAAIVAFGSSTTDGDGSTKDANRRWPDVLAERLQKESGRAAEAGVLNEGIIGNRLLFDSPRVPGNPFGPSLGEAGLARFERDVLAQPGVKYVFLALGVNDILFPGFPFTPLTEIVSVEQIIAGYRQLIARSHQRHVRIVATTIPPFEGATFNASGLKLAFYSPEREQKRAAVNDWIRRSGAFDAVVDFDAVLRDPSRPTQLRPDYAAEDHLHVNDAGNVAAGNAVPLSLFQRTGGDGGDGGNGNTQSNRVNGGRTLGFFTNVSVPFLQTSPMHFYKRLGCILTKRSRSSLRTSLLCVLPLPPSPPSPLPPGRVTIPGRARACREVVRRPPVDAVCRRVPARDVRAVGSFDSGCQRRSRLCGHRPLHRRSGLGRRIADHAHSRVTHDGSSHARRLGGAVAL